MATYLPIVVFLMVGVPVTSWAFLPRPTELGSSAGHHTLLRGSSDRPPSIRRSRTGPLPMVASAKPNVQDTGSIISDMESWARLITPETHIQRQLKYKVSAGTSLPEVFFDLWKAVSETIDEHRSTGEDKSFRQLVMFVAPFCEELKDYEAMEHMDQLLQQSARDGSCVDFGKAITHMHFHPNFRYRPRPKEMRMASRHAPHPSFSIDAFYRTGGRRSLTSMRASAAGQRRGSANPLRPRANVPLDGRSDRARRRNEEWAAQARSSLEVLYNTAAAYGTEESASDCDVPTRPLTDRGVPESSLEILEATQDWLALVLEEAEEMDVLSRQKMIASRALAAKGRRRFRIRNASGRDDEIDDASLPCERRTAFGPLTTAAPTAAHVTNAAVVAASGLESRTEDRSTAFRPPTANEVSAAISSAQAAEESKESAEPEKISTGGNIDAAGVLSSTHAGASDKQEDESQRQDSAPVNLLAGRGDDRDRGGAGDASAEEEDDRLVMPAKELVKRMNDVGQYIVARSKTAEEAYADVWEVIAEMAERAAIRGCNVPTEDYSSTAPLCYGAVMVLPDFATFSADAFTRFREIINRGLKHLPMEHDISLEAFHPEAVSEVSPLEHTFARAPYPTLHLCYHGMRTEDSHLFPAVASRKST